MEDWSRKRRDQEGWRVFQEVNWEERWGVEAVVKSSRGGELEEEEKEGGDGLSSRKR